MFFEVWLLFKEPAMNVNKSELIKGDRFVCSIGWGYSDYISAKTVFDVKKEKSNSISLDKYNKFQHYTYYQCYLFLKQKTNLNNIFFSGNMILCQEK